MEILIVGVGGIFGGILRFWLGKTVSQNANTTFPIGTFLINITGAFLLGILTGINPSGNIYLFWVMDFWGHIRHFRPLCMKDLTFLQGTKKRMHSYIF